MIKEEIDRSCLKDLDENDFNRLDIKSFKNNHSIYLKIQRLVSRNKNAKNNECIVCMDVLASFACITCGHQYLCHGNNDKIKAFIMIGEKRLVSENIMIINIWINLRIRVIIITNRRIISIKDVLRCYTQTKIF